MVIKITGCKNEMVVIVVVVFYFFDDAGFLPYTLSRLSSAAFNMYFLLEILSISAASEEADDDLEAEGANDDVDDDVDDDIEAEEPDGFSRDAIIAILRASSSV